MGKIIHSDTESKGMKKDSTGSASTNSLHRGKQFLLIYCIARDNAVGAKSKQILKETKYLTRSGLAREKSSIAQQKISPLVHPSSPTLLSLSLSKYSRGKINQF